ncbi:MAG: hypothetical protein GKS06_09570 [Acidobacteria bacterium]|nr:hypothetical protein [Acidobacteriota bacterium]
MSFLRPRRLVGFVLLAVSGYGLAFVSGLAGLAFGALFLLGAVGEIGIWAEVLHGWRRTES